MFCTGKKVERELVELSHAGSNRYLHNSRTFRQSQQSRPVAGSTRSARGSSAPNDWTVAISYSTGSAGLGIEQNTSSMLDHYLATRFSSVMIVEECQIPLSDEY